MNNSYLLPDFNSNPQLHNQLLSLIVHYFYSSNNNRLQDLAIELSNDREFNISSTNHSFQLSNLIKNYQDHDLYQLKVQNLIVELFHKIQGKARENDKDDQILELINITLFLESLYLNDNKAKALSILRTINDNSELVNNLSPLLLNPTGNNSNFLNSINWNSIGSIDQSRDFLLDNITKLLPNDKFILNGRLIQLVNQALNYQQSLSPNYFSLPASRDKNIGNISLYNDITLNSSKLPLNLKYTLSNHKDEVWFIKYSNDGKYLASCSKDMSIIVYDCNKNYKIMKYLTGHSGPVIYLSWSPDNTKLISSSYDQSIRIWSIEEGNNTNHCFTIQNSNLFNNPIRVSPIEFVDDEKIVIGSNDKKLTVINLDGEIVFDFLIDYRIEDFTVLNDYLYTITHESQLIVFDLTNFKEINCFKIDEENLLSVTSSKKHPNHILINIKPDKLQLWNISNPHRPYLENVYFKSLGSNFIIRGCLSDENLVLNGSANGDVHVYNSNFGNLVDTLHPHNALVNAITWRPNPNNDIDTCEWASCSDDHTVSVFGIKGE